jgi:four helix bundle protein
VCEKFDHPASVRLFSQCFHLARSVHCRQDMTTPVYQSYGQEIRDRAFEFACEIVLFSDALFHQGGMARVLAPQLVRSGTSIGANLEEARGGESRPDFISKCSIALKESRESTFRLRVADRCRLGPERRAAILAKEAGEIAAILGAIVRNARRNLKASKSSL